MKAQASLYNIIHLLVWSMKAQASLIHLLVVLHLALYDEYHHVRALWGSNNASTLQQNDT